MPSNTRSVTASSETREKIFQMVSSGLFIALVAAGARLSIPFWPVPLTMQSLFVLLTGYLLGARTATLAMIVYVLVGLMGFPVFARGGGPGYLLQPTFGYLLGYIAAAGLVGRLVHGARSFSSFAEISRNLQQKSVRTLVNAGIFGTLAIFLPGVFYLYFWMKINGADPAQQPALMTVLYSGFIVFIPGAVAKLAGILFIIRMIVNKESKPDAT